MSLRRLTEGVESATVGILCDPYLHEWQVRAIEQMQFETGIDVPLVVIEGDDEGATDGADTRNTGISPVNVIGFLKLWRRTGAWALVVADRRIGNVLGDEHPLEKRIPIETVECLADADHVRCEPTTDGAWSELPEDIVDLVAENCDVAVRFRINLVRGGILSAPKYGVLSFHPADIRTHRGLGASPTYVDGRDTAGSTLQRLNETIDGGEICAYDEVDIRGCHTLWDVWDRINAMQIRLLTEGIKNLRDPTFEPTIVPEEELGEMYYKDRRRELGYSGRIVGKNLYGRLLRGLE